MLFKFIFYFYYIYIFYLFNILIILQFESLFHQAFPAFWLPKYVNIGSLILSQSVGLCKTTVYVLELHLY